MIDWNPYLQALCNKYAQWWKVYTLTDVVGRQRVEEKSPPLLDFMVETLQPAKEQPGAAQQKTERLGVLEGLRKYAADHVLLVGRPGSGKSTALARLVLEEAQPRPEINFRADSESRLKTTQAAAISPFQRTWAMSQGIDSLADSPIPVLVELRYYQTSVLDLIRDFLKQYGLFLNTSEIERLLFEKRFLLLVDGINELPSEAARRDLKAFRQTNAATPMIFTTRDLGVGSDLDIAKKLEMQPLSKAQMQQFVRAYLPEQGEQMLRQMGSRLREFGQTPLLLWMLCSLFRAMGKVPPNLGLVFRQFALSYDRKLKQDIPISKESRRWWHRLLEHLAWVMTSGKEKTELQFAIPRQQAEAVLTEFLAGKVAHPEDCALCWLEDLLNHHLIQLGAGNQIEFRHQLIQEYYTAESLLKLLPSLSDDELKREYLNYLKWTEPLALMLELVEDEAQAVRVVKLALEVDWLLGARLVEAVKPEWQETVRLVAGLETPQKLRSEIWGMENFSILIIDDNLIVFEKKTIKNESFYSVYPSNEVDFYGCNLYAIRIICTSSVKETLYYEDYFTSIRTAIVSKNIANKLSVFTLIQAVKHKDFSVRIRASILLGYGNKETVNAFIKAVYFKNKFLPIQENINLEIGNQETAMALMQLLKHEDYPVRFGAAIALGNIRNKAALNVLTQAVNHEDYYIRIMAVIALGNISDKISVATLRKAVKDKNYNVRLTAVNALEKINIEASILALIETLDHQDYYVRFKAAIALGNKSNQVAVPLLLQALKYADYYIRWKALTALENIGNEAAVNALVKVVIYEDFYSRYKAANALGNIGNEIAVSALIQALEDENYDVCIAAVEGLGKIGNKAAIYALVEIVNHKDYKVREKAINWLEKIAIPEVLPYLSALYRKTRNQLLSNTIAAIQKRCKFYNYTLTQPILTLESQFNNPLTQPISTRLMHILHLSDLHFGTLDQANLWSNQLASDLYNDLSIPHLDALILSGDIANYSTEEEYKAAEQFLHNLCRDFPLKPEQIILVPGNHDINWKATNWEMADDVAYTLKLRRQCKPHELQEGYYIEESSNAVWVRDDEKYKQRFAHFSSFYETIKQKPYPLDYDQQYTLDHLKEQNLLILGLNSAWQLDHHYKTRASINTNALSNALTQIRRNPDYRNCLKIAVWHHPLDSAYSDRITDQGFLEQLAVNGFRLFLHGHIHKAETSLFRYDMSTNGRKLDRICAGTFGAPIREWVPGYPLQYNLLKIADNQLTVYTRCRKELNGAWKPDACWGQGAGKTPLDYYAIAL